MLLGLFPFFLQHVRTKLNQTNLGSPNNYARMKEDTDTLAELMLHAEQFCSKVEEATRDVAPIAGQTELRLKIGQCKNQLAYLQEFYNAGNLTIENAEVRAIFRQLVTALLWIAFYARSTIDYKTFRKLVLNEHGFAYLLASR